MNTRPLLDLFFPRTCVGCHRAADHEHFYLCWDCMANTMPVKAPFCERCGDPVEGRVDAAFQCYACTGSTPSYDRARSAMRYDGLIKDMLRHFKYEGATWLLNDLNQFLYACARTTMPDLEVDFVCPVPLYHVRQRERGYNQAGLLAGALAKTMDLPPLLRSLVRKKPTSTQTNLTARQRLTNVRGAFDVRKGKSWPGQRVLLVDDVMTTGATVNECARVLKKHGATYVAVLTVARG